MFSAELLRYFEHPRNAGDLPSATSRVTVTNPVCADILELFLLVEDGRIRTARFRAKGCVPSMACAAALTEAIEGLTLTDAALISTDSINQLVGGVPAGSSHALQLALDALNEALTQSARAKAVNV